MYGIMRCLVKLVESMESFNSICILTLPHVRKCSLSPQSRPALLLDNIFTRTSHSSSRVIKTSFQCSRTAVNANGITKEFCCWDQSYCGRPGWASPLPAIPQLGCGTGLPCNTGRELKIVNIKLIKSSAETHACFSSKAKQQHKPDHVYCGFCCINDTHVITCFEVMLWSAEGFW